MSADAITLRGQFFGDGPHDFALTDAMIAELERIAGKGIGALFLAVVASQFTLVELVETIRLGLVGGGMNPQRALELVETYARNRPLAEVHPLALAIIETRYSGNTPETTE